MAECRLVGASGRGEEGHTAAALLLYREFELRRELSYHVTCVSS